MSEDGFGQSFADELRFIWRCRSLRKLPIDWRGPTLSEKRGWADHPLLGRFGDETVAVADLDGRMLAVRERHWFGWPDPPQYGLFALEADGSIWCARDLDNWPRRWTIDGELPR